MCRIFAFRSILNSSAHSSLIDAENALGKQGEAHPDGWGVSFYLKGIPHVLKSEKSAFNNLIFKKVSGIVSSQTVLAHIRKATKGKKNILNTHPFQYGKWTFIHNGNISNFLNIKNKLLTLVKEEYRPFIIGETDSEVIFYILLSFIKSSFHDDLLSAVKEIINIIGALDFEQSGNKGNYLTFVITNGTKMFAFQGGKNLFFSTYKNKCIERDTCQKFSSICEKKASNYDIVNHLLFSSSPIVFEKEASNFNNLWEEMSNNQAISINENYKLSKSVLSL